MVRKTDTRCILVCVERPYIQCSLLLVLPCTRVLVVGGYKVVERGMAPRHCSPKQSFSPFKHHLNGKQKSVVLFRP
jgi:hypothetical protein